MWKISVYNKQYLELLMYCVVTGYEVTKCRHRVQCHSMYSAVTGYKVT